METLIQTKHDDSTPYQIFVLALSILAIVGIAITTLLELDPSVKVIFHTADYIICFLFFLDFLHCLWKAENKRKYLFTWGWLDLISSLPMVDLFRWGRAARAVRIIRAFRAFRSAKIISFLILKHRAQSAFLAVSLISLLLLVIGSTAILQFEKDDPSSNIKTAQDALWWSAVTITTVGYGDRFPVTTDGRIIACVLMVGGVGLFGTFSGFVASWFLAAAKHKDSSDDTVSLEKLAQQLKELRLAVEANMRTNAS